MKVITIQGDAFQVASIVSLTQSQDPYVFRGKFKIVIELKSEKEHTYKYDRKKDRDSEMERIIKEMRR